MNTNNWTTMDIYGHSIIIIKDNLKMMSGCDDAMDFMHLQLDPFIIIFGSTVYMEK